MCLMTIMKSHRTAASEAGGPRLGSALLGWGSQAPNHQSSIRRLPTPFLEQLYSVGTALPPPLHPQRTLLSNSDAQTSASECLTKRTFPGHTSAWCWQGFSRTAVPYCRLLALFHLLGNGKMCAIPCGDICCLAKGASSL